jgi:hypothetical protein
VEPNAWSQAQGMDGLGWSRPRSPQMVAMVTMNHLKNGAGGGWSSVWPSPCGGTSGPSFEAEEEFLVKRFSEKNQNARQTTADDRRT